MKYIRAKGKWSNKETKYVIEEDGKYLKTVPKVEELYSMLCLDVNDSLLSCSDRENKEKEAQKFSQQKLCEPQEVQINKTDRDKIDEVFRKLGVV